MAKRPITVSFEILLAISRQGAILTWPSDPQRSAECVVGVGGSALLETVIVNPDRTITMIVDDPTWNGETQATPMWTLSTN